MIQGFATRRDPSDVSPRLARTDEECGSSGAVGGSFGPEPQAMKNYLKPRDFRAMEWLDIGTGNVDN